MQQIYEKSQIDEIEAQVVKYRKSREKTSKLLYILWVSSFVIASLLSLALILYTIFEIDKQIFTSASITVSIIVFAFGGVFLRWYQYSRDNI